MRCLATSAIDISDGLTADLGHILERSNVGAQIFYSTLPVSRVQAAYATQALGQRCVLAGGDDYELCFTAPAEKHAELEKLAVRLNLPLTCIGKISTGSGCKVYADVGGELIIGEAGYEHFK